MGEAAPSSPAQVGRSRPPRLAQLGILLSGRERRAASSPASMRSFAREARRHDLRVERIGRADIAALDRLDALFIRDLTSPRNHTYAFATGAEERGVAVLDDARSISRCSDKCLLNELLMRHGIPAPQTLIVSPDTPVQTILEAFGLPVLLKTPEGSFSDGVERASSRQELALKLAELRRRSPVVVAQEYLPTAYDWRVGVLGGEPLFACRYHMARGHWQIIQHGGGLPREGRVEPLPWRDAPGEAVDLALRASRLMGNGLYGVDIKQRGDRFFVIEVNDNPDLDADHEASSPSDRVWQRLAEWFMARVRSQTPNLRSAA